MVNANFLFLRITMKNGLIIECHDGYYYREQDSNYITIIEPQERGYRPYKITEVFANEVLIMEHTERS